MKILESFHMRGVEEIRTVSIYNGGSLADEMQSYRRELGPGGRCHHVTEALGYAPIPFRAVVRRGHVRGKILERWASVSVDQYSSALTEVFQGMAGVSARLIQK